MSAQVHDKDFVYHVDPSTVSGDSVVGRVTTTTNPDPRVIGSVMKVVGERELNMLTALPPGVAPEIISVSESTSGDIPAGSTVILMRHVGPDLGLLVRDVLNGKTAGLTSDQIDQTLVLDFLDDLTALEESGIEATQLRAEHVLVDLQDPDSTLRLCGFGGAKSASSQPGREQLHLWAEMLQKVLRPLSMDGTAGTNPEALRRTLYACLKEDPSDRPSSASEARAMATEPVPQSPADVRPAIALPSEPKPATLIERTGHRLNQTAADRWWKISWFKFFLAVALVVGCFIGITAAASILGR